MKTHIDELLACAVAHRGCIEFCNKPDLLNRDETLAVS